MEATGVGIGGRVARRIRSRERAPGRVRVGSGVLAPLYRLYTGRLRAQVRSGRLPQHVALILDGNRRWATLAGLREPGAGYRQGADKLDELLGWCAGIGIRELTVWALSGENLSRSEAELAALTEILAEKLTALAEREPGQTQPLRVRVIGRLETLPAELVRAARQVQEQTAANEGLCLNIALGYSGRDELVDAVRALLGSLADRGIPAGELAAHIDAEAIARHLYTAERADPDLIIRTSGEMRLSGFMPWQSSHSEFYFSDIYWPAFRELDFLRAVRTFQARERRFGRRAVMAGARRQPMQQRSHAERLASRDGYFAPESVIRRVGNTPVTPFLGGGTAVLLQVAHPLVAAGVADHSDYHYDLWRRLGRTLRALYLITFGSRSEAEQAGAVVRAVHRHVHGTTRTRLGRFPAGTAYSACDPQLLLWVHATLVHASLSAYQRFERALSDAEQERYYQEMAVVGTLFGVPAHVIPPSLAAFRDYLEAQLASETITVTPVARAIAQVILQAPLPTPLRLFTPAHRLATSAQLPPRLRHEYGLRWTPLHTLALPPAARSLKLTATPLLLAAARLRPAAKLAA